MVNFCSVVLRNFLNRTILCVLLCLCESVAFSQNENESAPSSNFSREFRIHYICDSINIDPLFVDNAIRLGQVRDFLRYIRDNKSFRLDSVKFTGTASPEGYYEANNWLSENRLQNFKKLIKKEIDVPDSIIYLNDNNITWKMFRDAVAASDIPFRDSVLKVLDMEPGLVYWQKGMHTDHRALKLRQMDGGKVYETLKPILFNQRFATAEFILSRLPEPDPLADLTRSIKIFYEPEPMAPEEWGVRRLYLKTNLAKWALLIANFAIEADIAAHWTLGLDMFYSNWDYFTPTTKFRMAGFMSELRYFFNPIENDGWFVGGHFGYSYYNMAFNGAHRYQDLYGETPTKGGGLSAGWRKQFGPKNKWRLEFSLGAGIYPLHYSVFNNTENYKHGQWIEKRKETFYGIDQISVTIGYAIDTYKYKKKQKGGGL